MAETFNSIMPGEVIDGKYTIGRVIGSGGMGTVYEAVHNDIKRRVALKVLHNKYAKSMKIVERFHQEARLAGSIEHDNICTVIDHGTSSSGVSYLVMPLLEGRSLAKMLEDKEPLSQLRTVDIICQTLQALEAAHGEKIVHRDLKPDNIFVTQMGDREDFVKLLDFGISKVLEKDSVSDLTSTGMVLGTAYYLAPEQARGSKKIDHRVDIYAMGVILYEALTGVRPFGGDTYNEVVFNIVGEPVKPPRHLNPSIAPGVERVILKAMSIDPGARFSSAKEMCAALESAVVDGASGADSTLLETLGDTEVEGRRYHEAISEQTSGQKRRIFVVIGGIVVAVAAVAGYLVLGASVEGETGGRVEPKSAEQGDSPSLGDTEPTPLAEEPHAKGGTVDTSAVAPRAAVDVDASDAPAPSIDTDSAPSKADPKEAAGPRSEVEAPASPNARKPPRQRSRKTPRGKGKQDDVIEGRFNTTFVFGED